MPADFDTRDSNGPGNLIAEPSRIRWRIFALACGASWLLYLHRYAWNIVGPKLQEEYQFDHTTSGWIFALFYATYSAGQIPSGILIDRFGPHHFLSAIIVVWSLVLSGFAWTGNLIVLGLLRFVFGAAQAGCYPGLNKVTRSWFPLRSRTIIQGWVATTFGRMGGAMSPIVLGTFLMGDFGLTWRASLVVLSAGGVLFGVVFWRMFRNTPEEHPAVSPEELLEIREGELATTHRPGILPWRTALRNRSLRVFLLQQYLDAGSDVVFVSLIGAYFLQAHHVDIKQTGWLASLPLWGGALGGIAGGWLNEKLIVTTGNRRWSRSAVGAVGKFVGCLLLLLLTTLSDPVSIGVALGLAKFFSDWSQPTVWGTCTDMAGRFTATVFSMINTAGTVGGLMMPVIFGKLLDAFTATATVNGASVERTSWAPLFYLVAAMYLGSGVCWLFLDCTNKVDS
ncbi:MAG TPA: MFS transporter [Caulifigura sp.]|jgi:sugar phosphate permease|nr:MFS transporter [Caulifigura sp.]